LISSKLTITFDYDTCNKSYTYIFTDDVLQVLYNHDSSVYGIHIATCSDKKKPEAIGARNAREMLKRLYFSSDAGLVNTLAKGSMLNTTVTPRDVLRATSIYGRDIPFIKGKKVNRPNMFARELLVSASMQKEQTVYMDVFFWKGDEFILGVLKPLDLYLVQRLTNHTAGELKDWVNKIIGKIRARSFTILKIITDPDASFKCLDGLIDVPWDTIGSRTHVEHAERVVRVSLNKDLDQWNMVLVFEL
jgi:hypothetical protein